MTPTTEYHALEEAFSHFNDRLFDNTLPSVLLTLRNHPRSRGYFRSKPFVNRRDEEIKTDEIALCANSFSDRTDKQILSTLVHEMCHLWQYTFGSPSRGWHNRQWAEKMLEIGLHPSDSGFPGGAMTGQKITHFIVEGGRFDDAAQELLETGWKLQWQEGTPQVAAAAVPGSNGLATPRSKRQTRKKFICGRCNMAAWAKFSANLVCGSCNNTMT